MDKTQIRLLEHKATGALFNITVNNIAVLHGSTTLPGYYSLAPTMHQEKNRLLLQQQQQQQQQHHPLGHRSGRYAVI